MARANKGSNPADAAATVSAAEAGSTSPSIPKKYAVSVYAHPPLLHEFAEAILELQHLMDAPIFLLIQNAGDWYRSLDYTLFVALLKSLDDLPCDKPVVLLIDSPGGFAGYAYRIATLFKEQCGGFSALIPRYAKSAATLLSLGANAILLGKHAELGPLDAQFDDPDREQSVSALDEVQALERLHAFALEAADRTMFLLLNRTGKKVEALLPLSLHFVADMLSPLFEKIDAVHYTQMSRALKVAEEYAIRLLQNRYAGDKAGEIARHLVEKYPEHEFVIDATEAAKIDRKLVTPLSVDQQRVIDKIALHLTQLTAIGFVKEVSHNVKKTPLKDA